MPLVVDESLFAEFYAQLPNIKTHAAVRVIVPVLEHCERAISKRYRGLIPGMDIEALACSATTAALQALISHHMDNRTAGGFVSYARAAAVMSAREYMRKRRRSPVAAFDEQRDTANTPVAWGGFYDQGNLTEALDLHFGLRALQQELAKMDRRMHHDLRLLAEFYTVAHSDYAELARRRGTCGASNEHHRVAHAVARLKRRLSERAILALPMWLVEHAERLLAEASVL